MLTTRCGLQCPYCHIPKGRDTMSGEILDRAVDMALDPCNPAPDIHFFGGEPLLEKKLMLRGARRAATRARTLGRALTVHVSTNCLAVNEAFVRSAAGLPFSFELSLDGSRGWNGAAHTKPGRFRDAARGAALLIQSGAECFVNMVVTPETACSLALNFEDILSTGASRVNISPATGVAWTPASAQALAAGLWDIYQSHVRSGKIRLLNLEQNAGAMLFNREVTVACDGTVYSGNAFLYCADTTARSLVLGHVSEGLPTQAYYVRRRPLSFYVENVFPRAVTLSYSHVLHVLSSFQRFAAQERAEKHDRDGQKQPSGCAAHFAAPSRARGVYQVPGHGPAAGPAAAVCGASGSRHCRGGSECNPVPQMGHGSVSG